MKKLPERARNDQKNKYTGKTKQNAYARDRIPTSATKMDIPTQKSAKIFTKRKKCAKNFHPKGPTRTRKNHHAGKQAEVAYFRKSNKGARKEFYDMPTKTTRKLLSLE